MNRHKAQRRSVFVCQECGYQSAKWLGFCPSPSCDSSLPLEESQAPPPGPAHNPVRPSWLASAAEPLQELAGLRPQDHQRIELASGRAEPGSGRRYSARFGDAAGWRTGCGQIHPAAPGGPAFLCFGRDRGLRQRGGVGPPGQITLPNALVLPPRVYICWRKPMWS